MPIMVLVDVDDRSEDQSVVLVVAADEHEDIALARDRDGHVLVYDEAMERLTHDEPITTAAVTLADSRAWPPDTDWEHGPDPLRDPFLYEETATEETDDELDVLALQSAGTDSAHAPRAEPT